MRSRFLPTLLLGAAGLLAGAAHAQITGDKVKIGILTDLSSQYADYGGPMSLINVQMAVERMGGRIEGKAIEVIHADHLQKVDVGLAIARRWYDEEGVDVIVEGGSSALAAALQGLARDKNKVYLTTAASSDLTGKLCTPNTAQFGVDTYSQAAVAAAPLTQRGLKTWFSLTVDYALGHALERDSFAVVKANGGTPVGAVRFPFAATDMSSFVLQAQAAKAQAISIAAGGGDVQTALRALDEYGVRKGAAVVALNVELLDSFKLGRKLLAGTYIPEYWYWDQDAETRAWSREVAKRHPKGYYPSRSAAALYSGTLHYLRAVAALKSDADGRAVMTKMKEMPVNDVYARNGRVREDGRLVKEMYLAQIKTPEESKGGDWDLYKIVATVPADKAFRPLAESECPLVRK